MRLTSFFSLVALATAVMATPVESNTFAAALPAQKGKGGGKPKGRVC
jgi:hypothetical protein